MFSFFGAFTDLDPEIRREFSRRWPDVDVVEIDKPFRGLAVRFHESVYLADKEGVPEPITSGALEISKSTPKVQIVLLRSECWGGICGNWGQFICGGTVQEN